MRYYTYILLCDNGSYYTGHTKNTTSRLYRHINKQGAKHTFKNKPRRILWKQEFKTEIAAIRREKQIKGWSRIKKEKLISGFWK
ncbi:MAG: GIY-YIG nuclease family protein [Patescibacteria group bacterium]|jgi:predicted GIY-YIG superfamily endonuclease